MSGLGERLPGLGRPRGQPHAKAGPEAQPEATGQAPSPTKRIIALDALRGLAIVLMVLINNAGVRESLPYHLRHPEWHGYAFIDAFFPAFLFTMGGAMVFSSRATSFKSVMQRVVALLVLGIVLQYIRRGGFILPGVLQKIALAYLIAWLVMRLPTRFHLAAAIGIVGGMWAAFVWVPAPGVVPGSWDEGTNFAAFIDRMIIGAPATEGPASAIMASANVILGAVVIRNLRGLVPSRATLRLVAWGAGSLAIGLLIAQVVPINKRMWTPSYLVVSHALTCLYLAGFWLIAEVWQRVKQVDPFVVLGRNPILIYFLFTASHAVMRPVRVSAMEAAMTVMPPIVASFVWSGTHLILAWLLALWLDRRRLYLKV